MPSSSPSGVANTKPVSSKVKEPFSSRLLSVLSLVVGVRGQVFGLTTGMVREFLAFKAFLSPGWRKAKLRLERKSVSNQFPFSKSKEIAIPYAKKEVNK